MLDITQELVALFKRHDIPLISEKAHDSAAGLPLVTYDEVNNADARAGDNIGYSSIVYTLNVWCQTKADNVALGIQVDAIMRSVKFERTGTVTWHESGVYRQTMTYSRLCREEYKEAE